MQSPQLKDRLLRPKEAAAMLGVWRQTLYNWVNAGLLPPPVRQGLRATGWRESTLLEFLKRAEAASATAHAARLEARAKRASASAGSA